MFSAHPPPLRRFRAWWSSTHTPARVAFRRPWPTTRRGLVLFLFALATAWLGGVNYLATNLPPASQESLAFALSITDADTWGWIMIGVGFFSAWSAYCHLGRDRIGFFLLALFTGAWGIGYLCGWLFYDAGLRALGGSVIWLLFSAILTAESGHPSTPLARPDQPSPACRPGGDE